MTRIAVLASGGGSNLQAILDYLDALGSDVQRPGGVVLVASDRARAGALERAARRGISTAVLDARQRDEGLLPFLRLHGIELVALAGYLRLVPRDVTAAYRGRVVNVHPSLLPAFGGAGMYGQRVHQAVLNRGVRVTGVTVHLVDAEYDQGPIIAQWPVPVMPGDDAATLASRVLEAEHRLYPRVVASLAAGRIRLEPDGHVSGDWGAGLPPDGHFAMVARDVFLGRGGAPPPGK
jgi:formyltetrahydrofolate-dependent phosphoribosylglycinamide formyltransferase